MQWFLRFCSIVSFAIGVMAITSCGQVEYRTSSVDAARSPLPTPILSTPSSEFHDIAITAVDFDPLPRPDQPLDAENSSLLAIVENKGNKVEGQITVSATLRTDNEEKPLYQSKAQIDRLVPGESKVVRFSKLGQVPLKSNYVLQVEAMSVPGETILENNSKVAKVDVVMTSH